MSSDYFSVLVILIIQRFDLALHASLMVVYLSSMFYIFSLKKNKKLGEKLQEFSFFGMLDIACVLISQVHCALIDYAYI
jgi:hypothetical protein